MTTPSIAALEEKVARLERINRSLMDRVEREVDQQGNAFSLFQTAIVLESKVRERTAELQAAMTKLETSNVELVRARDAADAASAAKSEFLANMSHEIRTPMNGVLGMTELLLATPLTEKQAKFARAIHRSARSLLGVINDILDFSKVEAGRLELETLDLDLRETVEEPLDLLGREAAAKGLSLTVSFAPGMDTHLRGDPGRIRQIVTNLVGNAIKFTHRGGVTVRVDREVGADGHVVSIEVEDTGIGIAPDVLPRLFQSFTQADGSTTRKYGGTGLGLAISRRLCGLMGGDITVRSVLGAGTTFRCTMHLSRAPVDTWAPRPEERERASSDGASLAGVVVLVAEDNAINREVASGLLGELGCDVRIAVNGREACAAVAHGGIDVVFMDCQMPEMDGFAAAAAIRQREHETGAARMPVIALTANALPSDRARCLDAGMDDFVAKPFQLRELADVLRRWRGLEPARPRPPAPTEARAKIIDEAALAQVVALDASRPGLLGRVVAKFTDDGDRTLGALAAAAAAGDVETLRREAHRMKGSSATLGAVALAAALAAVEKGADGSESPAPAHVDHLLALHADAVRALAERVATVEATRARA